MEYPLCKICKSNGYKKIKVYQKDELVGEVPVKTLTDLAPVCHHSFKNQTI
jgi:hypothetical protein